MSEFPPAPPLPPATPAPPFDYRPEPPSSSGPEWSAAVAWVLILASVAFVAVTSAMSKSRAATATTRATTTATTRPSSMGSANVQFDIIGKYAVGAHQMLAGVGGQTKSARPADLIGQVDKLATTNRTKVDAAIVAGELLGVDEASKRLDAIEADPHLSANSREDATALRGIYSAGPASLSEAARARLLERHGFFGRLALAYGISESDPQRKAVLAEAHRSARTVLVLVLVGGLLAVVSFVLLVVAIILFATGTLRRNYAPQPNAPTVFVEMFAVYLLSFVGLSLLLPLITGEDRAERSLVGSWLMIAPAGLIIPIVYGLLRGVRWSELRRGLGWERGKGWYVEIPLGIIGYFACLPLVMCGFAITAFLVSRSGTVPSHPIQNAPLDTLGQILGLYFVASVGAPIIEETMFRGGLLHHLRRRWGWLFSAAVVALIFAAIHPQGWTTIPALGSIAVALAALREWRGSTLAPMAAHALNNGAVLTLFLLLR